jgi:diacylglycerol kinase (ATP)
MPAEWILALTVAAAAAAFVAIWLGIRRTFRRRTEAGPADPPAPVLPDQRVVFILNPVKNGAAEARIQVEAACAAAGWSRPLVLETTPDDPGHGQAKRALEERPDVVIAGGGDGTIRVVASELCGTQVPMGVLPLGTGNLLARNLGLEPSALQANINVALHGVIRKIDTADITLENEATGARREDSFLVIAGIGVDADVLADTRDDLKRRFGWMAYSEAGVRHLAGQRKRVMVSIDGRPAQLRKVRSILLANCGRLPAGIDFIPTAEIDDGEIDIVVLSPRSVVGWLWIAGKTLVRHTAPIPVIEYHRGRTVRITAHDPMGTQLDGDPSGPFTSLTVEVKPRSLAVRTESIPSADGARPAA